MGGGEDVRSEEVGRVEGRVDRKEGAADSASSSAASEGSEEDTEDEGMVRTVQFVFRCVHIAFQNKNKIVSLVVFTVRRVGNLLLHFCVFLHLCNRCHSMRQHFRSWESTHYVSALHFHVNLGDTRGNRTPERLWRSPVIRT